MKKEYFSWIRNPMTLIALFVGLTEIGLGLITSNVSGPLKDYLALLIFWLPIINTIGFFIVLFFRPQNFYGPSDYSNDSNYVSIVKGFSLMQENIDHSEKQTGSKHLSKESIQVSIGKLPIDFCYSLLKIADEPKEVIEFFLDLSNDLKLANFPSAREEVRLFSAFGYFICATRMGYSHFFMAQEKDNKAFIGLKKGVRDLLIKRIAKAAKVPRLTSKSS